MAAALCPYWGKLFLMFWGGDMYPFLDPSNVASSPKARLRRFILRCAIRRAAGIINLKPADQLKLKEICVPKGVMFLGSVPGETRESSKKRSEAMLSILEKDKPANPTRILLGNSASPTNRHVDVIDELKKFKDQNIVVYAPLSYGDKQYRDEIVEYGKTVLGSKFVPLLEFMDKAAYDEFLQTITIGIFNFNRQQGLGNVSLLMRYGAKVYVSRDNPVREDYLREGCVLFDVEGIPGMSFEEFVERRRSDLQENIRLFDPFALHEKSVEKWLKIYDWLM